jgi:catechol-2,3-dioxygenase
MAVAKKDLPTAPYVVDPRVRIGHVHLKVADLRGRCAFMRECGDWK